MAKRININCDMGEGFGRWTLGDDAGILPLVPTANIATGFHGGDPTIMRRVVGLAQEVGADVGAHVSLPDLLGFGRRRMAVTPDEIYDYTLYQAGALRAFAEAAGGRLQHVKPHGALFNMAVKNRELSDAIARGVAAFDRSLILFGLPGSEILAAARAAGLRVAAEIFADRAYEPDGQLVSRRKPGAVIHDPEQVVSRAVKMVKERGVTAVDGTFVPLDAETICVHGDTAGSDVLAARLRAGFAAAGVEVRAVGQN